MMIGKLQEMHVFPSTFSGFSSAFTVSVFFIINEKASKSSRLTGFGVMWSFMWNWTVITAGGGEVDCIWLMNPLLWSLIVCLELPILNGPSSWLLFLHKGSENPFHVCYLGKGVSMLKKGKSNFSQSIYVIMWFWPCFLFCCLFVCFGVLPFCCCSCSWFAVAWL